MIRFQVLGTVDLRDAEGRELHALLRRPKLVALLSYLAMVRPVGYQRRDNLVALLWPELDNSHARNALRQSVHEVRGILAPTVLVARGDEELAVNTEEISCDVRDFELALDAGDEERALELYGGEPLSGFHIAGAPEFERWLDERRAALHHRACDAARRLVARESAARNPAGAARWASRLLELSPTDETVLRQLLQLLDAAGDRAGAIRAFETFARRLLRDLELEPSAETRSLVESIRSRRDSAKPASSPVPVPNAAHEAEQPAAAPAPMRRRRPLTAFLSVSAAALITTGWFVVRSPSLIGGAVHQPKRLVVLPFANLGAPDDRYFADGMREELTARLAAIDGFQLVGNASANRYRNSEKSPAEISRDLGGVDFILQASVRWDKSSGARTRVRVTPQLVNAKDGSQLWAQIYDEPLDGVFRVQSDIATQVVRALDLALSKSQREVVTAVPTRNLEAYDFYLRGSQYPRRGATEQNIRAAATMAEKAVALDSGFAQAYSLMSRMYTRLYWAYVDHSRERLELARQAADKAVALSPDLGDSHLALAIYYGLGIGDYDQSMREYSRVEAAGASTEFYLGRAVVRQRHGHYSEAIADFEKARQMDPAAAVVYSNYAHAYAPLREYVREEALLDRAIALAPDLVPAHLDKIWLYVRWDGNTRRAWGAMAQAERDRVAGQDIGPYWRVLLEIFDRHYDKALALLSSGLPEILEADHARMVPRAQLNALVYSLTSRPDLARAAFDTCLRITSKKVEDDPDDPRARTALGIAYAGLGRKQEAIQQGLKALELMPMSRDAFKGYNHEWEVARIYTMVGEQDIAISKLEHLLAIPGYLTPGWLRIDPVWDPLRGNPRFQKLVGGAP